MMIETNYIDIIFKSIFIVIYTYKLTHFHQEKVIFKSIISLILLMFIPFFLLYYQFPYVIFVQFLITIIIFQLFSNNNLIDSIFSSLIVFFMYILSYVLVSWVMKLISYEVIFPITYTIFFSHCIWILLMILTFRYIYRYLSQSSLYTSQLTLILIFLLLLYLSLLITIFVKEELFLETTIEIFIVTVIVVLVFHLINKIIFVEKENSHMKLVNQELLFQQKNYKSIEKNIEEAKKEKHNKKHLILALIELCNHENYDELKSELYNENSYINKTSQIINTGNSSLDFIISTYEPLFEENNISFICNSFDDSIHFDKIDFYIIIGNLLDNAVQHCSANTNKKIILDIYTLNDDLYIQIKNTCIENPLKDNAHLLTTKTDKQNHGYGILSVKSLVEKYNGEIHFENTLHYFIVTLRLKNTVIK